MNCMRALALLAGMLAVFCTTADASEQTTDRFLCILGGNQVVPPLSQQYDIGLGSFNTNAANQLIFTLLDTCGSGVLARAYEVHIHGPAMPNEIGPVLVTLIPDQYGNYGGTLGPLDAQQIRDLNCGLWYVDAHTPQNPWGEVRGRIRGLWGWSPSYPCSLPVEASTWGMVKSLYR